MARNRRRRKAERRAGARKVIPAEGDVRGALDHFAAGAAVDRVPQGLDVGLFRPPLDERGKAPLGEAMGGRNDRLAAVVLARFHFAYDAGAVLGIDVAVAPYPDFREPD